MAYIQEEPRLIRPLNYPETTPGAGVGFFEARNGARVCVAQVMGGLFMEPLGDPFEAVESCFSRIALGRLPIVLRLTFTRRRRARKWPLHIFWMGGSLWLQELTHIPTADAQVLPGGTAYQTDVGMCGDYDSVIDEKRGCD